MTSYIISHRFDRVLSTVFQPRFFARLRVALPFTLVMVVPPSPIAPLETFGFLGATGDGLSRWLFTYLSLNRFAVAGQTEEVVNVFGNLLLEVAHDGWGC